MSDRDKANSNTCSSDAHLSTSHHNIRVGLDMRDAEKQIKLLSNELDKLKQTADELNAYAVRLEQRLSTAYSKQPINPQSVIDAMQRSPEIMEKIMYWAGNGQRRTLSVPEGVLGANGCKTYSGAGCMCETCVFYRSQKRTKLPTDKPTGIGKPLVEVFAEEDRKLISDFLEHRLLYRVLIAVMTDDGFGVREIPYFVIAPKNKPEQAIAFGIERAISDGYAAVVCNEHSATEFTQPVHFSFDNA